jgi:hypothetical protein
MQLIDPTISRLKFQKELEAFTAGETIQRRRGIFLLDCNYPDMIFAFAATQLRPLGIIFAVKINFDNYDLEPLSVRFVNPLTFEYLVEAPVPMVRKNVTIEGKVEIQELAQKDEMGFPFICIPGIREYHEHPAHTGDLWLLHRKKGGEGTLGFILDKMYTYGIAGISNYTVNAVVKSIAVGVNFDINRIPE